MRKLDYNQEMYYQACIIDAKIAYSGKSNEWYHKVASEKLKFGRTEILKMNMVSKLKDEGLDCKLAKLWVDRIVDGLPPNFHKNIEEFIDDKPISKISYKDLSIKEIMKQGEKVCGVEYSFVLSAWVFSKYVNGIYTDKEMCFDYFLSC